jgi:hypothetical protein
VPLHISIMTMAGMLVVDGTEFTIQSTHAAGTN